MHQGAVLKGTGSMNAAFVEGACRVIECEDVLVAKVQKGES